MPVTVCLSCGGSIPLPRDTHDLSQLICPHCGNAHPWPPGRQINSNRLLAGNKSKSAAELMPLPQVSRLPITKFNQPQSPASREDRSSALSTQTLHQEIEQLECRCAIYDELFSALFVREDPNARFIFDHTERGSGAIHRHALDRHDELTQHGGKIRYNRQRRTVDDSAFDFTGWSCPWCEAQESFYCPRCNVMVCQSRIFFDQGQKWAACPDSCKAQPLPLVRQPTKYVAHGASFTGPVSTEPAAASSSWLGWAKRLIGS